MTKTNTKYINEYSLFDDVFEFVEKCNNELDSIMYNYKMEQRQNELRSFFEAEAVDNETKNSGEKEGILTKIGNVVLTLLKKISDFITSITSKLFKNKKKIETDVDKVNRIIKNNPSGRSTVTGASISHEYALFYI